MRAIAWTCAGTISALIGLIGVVVPIFPGIIFMVIAALCFIRASRVAPRRDHAGINPVLVQLDLWAVAVQLRFWLLARRLLPGRGRNGSRHGRG